MARRFYLSIVYDFNGYDRLDLTSRDSLKELDEVVSNYHNRDEVIEAYCGEYHIDKKKGRVCIVYEDTDKKNKEIKLHGNPDKYSIEERTRIFSYAHIIPIMYADERLMNLDACLLYLKQRLRNDKIKNAIMHDRYTSKGQVIRTNKKYLFETGEEQDYIESLSDYDSAIYLFLKRISKEPEEEQYFYFRSLMDLCKLSVKEKKKVKNVRISKKDIKNIIENMELTKSEKLEREAIDMDEFYLHHDLDEVIKYSPDSSRPIGSERKKK